MATRPNIILILADDMGYGDFGLFNDGPARTPTLDALAAESVCFTQHYSGSCVCAPARAALLTGRYPHRTGAIDTLEGRGLDRLALSERTLADALGAAGYATGLVGKWHLGALDPRYHPNARGFDEFAGFRGGWQDYYEWRLDRDGSYSDADGRYLTDVFTDEAVGFIERHAREPFFLHVAYNAPHFPFQAPQEELDAFAEHDDLTRAVRTIYAMNRRMDRGVERILDALERQGLRENTIVLFTSDNGPQFGGEGEDCTDRFNCHYHGAKGSVYEGGIRVPMLARWPAGFDGGRATDALTHFCDWFPTLLEAAGAESPREVALDGQSLLGLLREQAAPPDLPRFWQWNRYTPVGECNAAVRDGDWKLVRPRIAEAMWVAPEDLAVDRGLKYEPHRHPSISETPEPVREIPALPRVELYNLALDPQETENLVERFPERAAGLLRALETWFDEVEAERRAIVDIV